MTGYTYTRTGAISAITDKLGTRNYAYGTASGFALSAEILPAYYNGGNDGKTPRQLTYGYDTLGRATHVSLGTAQAPASELAFAYTMGTTGLITALTASPAGQLSRTFNYNYTETKAPWRMNGLELEPTTADASTLSRSFVYEPIYGRVQTIDTAWGSASQSRHDYTYDARSLRITAAQSGAFFNDYGENTYYRYSYNARRELSSATQYLGNDVNGAGRPLPGRQFGYTYDAMGNRLSTTRTGDTGPEERYEANALNQITKKENHTVPLSGTMKEGARVVARGTDISSSAAYQGRFWGIETTLPNSNSPAKAQIELTFGKRGGSAGGVDAFETMSRTASIAPALEAFSYDADGNLTLDGLWSYTYDAENQLVAMETRSNAISTLSAIEGKPKPCKLEFTYDHQGRRVGKKVYDWKGSTWNLSREMKYMYYGWNLIAEYDATTGSPASSPTVTYYWGLDVAGSLGATGGVGALLMIQEGAESYYPAYDGNGNVTGLLDKSGNTAAKYEYNPYGEPVRIEGSRVDKNPFRWSTKYTDVETGLVYYGLRYYAPRIGRFINRDPIKETGGLNTYAFVGNGPVNSIDILGLEEVVPMDPLIVRPQEEEKKDTEDMGGPSAGGSLGFRPLGGIGSNVAQKADVIMDRFDVYGKRDKALSNKDGLAELNAEIQRLKDLSMPPPLVFTQDEVVVLPQYTVTASRSEIKAVDPFKDMMRSMDAFPNAILSSALALLRELDPKTAMEHMRYGSQKYIEEQPLPYGNKVDNFLWKLKRDPNLQAQVYLNAVMMGVPLSRAFSAERTALYRAVGPAELADIRATGALRNLGSAEGKYFTTSAVDASAYAKQAVRSFGDPPYTIIRTEVPKSIFQGAHSRIKMKVI